MNKKAPSETDIRSKFITPTLCGQGGAGWDLMTQVRDEAYFTNLIFISLVGFTTGRHAELSPLPELARQRISEWLTQQETAAGKLFTAEQRAVSAHIIDEVGANVAPETDDLDHGTLKSCDGLPRSLALFGRESQPVLLEEFNTALAA